ARGIGASIAAGAAGGAASTTLTTTAPRALVYGVGNDWDNSLARTLIAGQAMVHQWVDTAVFDSFWSQSAGSQVLHAGTAVTLGTPGPTSDRWNFAVVEIFP